MKYVSTTRFIYIVTKTSVLFIIYNVTLFVISLPGRYQFLVPIRYAPRCSTLLDSPCISSPPPSLRHWNLRFPFYICIILWPFVMVLQFCVMFCIHQCFYTICCKRYGIPYVRVYPVWSFVFFCVDLMMATIAETFSLI